MAAVAKKRAKRVGRTRTFGISVDAETERFLRREAEARFGGNVSRLVTALAREEKSRLAAGWVVADSKSYAPMTDEELGAFVSRFSERRARRKKPAA
ncbi:MAG: hypothetical protein KF819_30600 [Labilithrix sp.]|nr:hypothetical protein [Labilithrix sp.]